MKAIIYNCRRATFLIEKKLMDKITFRETAELRLHLLGCRMCRLYEGQSQMITQMLRHIFQPKNRQQIKLDGVFKAALTMVVDKQLNKH